MKATITLFISFSMLICINLTMRSKSPGTFAGKDDPNCLKKNLEIKE